MCASLTSNGSLDYARMQRLKVRMKSGVQMHSAGEEYHLEIAQLVREETEERVGLAARERSETSVEEIYERM